VKIVCFTGDLNLLAREFMTQNEDWIIRRIRVLVNRNMEFVGKRVLNMYGSKEEKISGIIARLEQAH
jgi:hypothetical protein